MPPALSAPRASKTRPVKQLIGPVYRAFHSARPVRNLTAPWLRGRSEVDSFSPDGRGLGADVALAKADGIRRLRGSTALLLGAGAGEEADLLALHGVGHVIGADLESHDQKWPLRRAQLARAGVRSTFSLMDAARLGLRDSSVDLVFSQSVLEHVVDMDSMLEETSRALNPNGTFVAWFGPLWTTFGGPHVADLAYDHLLVSESELLERARAVGDGWEYWLELGLFNRYRYQDYLDSIGRHYDIRWLGIAGSAEGAKYRDEHPDVWRSLLETHDEIDLLTRLVGIVATPKK